MNTQIHHGDCLEVMKTLGDNSVDSIVTDPPYGLGFMGKKWDALPPGEAWARECLRVLKPGGHLLAFGGTRTWHRLAVSVEDAGFEVRDSIAWMHSEGFPKHRTALKPAFEPIVMARKPFRGSLAVNESVRGTGALKIDACRIAGNVDEMRGRSGTSAVPGGNTSSYRAHNASGGVWEPVESGRWPANVVLDEPMADVLDRQSGHSKSPATYVRNVNSGSTGDNLGRGIGEKAGTASANYGDSGGASRFFYVAKASKKERPVVEGVAHPTVKPLALMRWLCKLVTPEGGTIMDPFAGSGTTVEAAILEGFNVIGIEREAEYLPLIEARIERAAA